MVDIRSYAEHQLNPQQRKAVEPKDGSLLVIAGAGSGKTRIITARIAYLIMHHGVLPEEIVALTFTNKAAKEMAERIESFLGRGRNIPFIGTFHAYCLRLLKQYPHIAEIPFFSIIDADDQEKIIKGILQRAQLPKQITAKQLLSQFSQLKNADSPHTQQALFMHYPKLEELYYAYEKEKKESRCLDFDDLLHHGLKLFNNEKFREDMQHLVRHLLIDEYQDTNVIQHAFLKALAKNAHGDFALDSLCIVGDEDQSIYSWRGATIANMVHFKKDFPHTQTIKIEQNYRSVQPILDIANTIIKQNKERNPKELWSEKTGSNRILQITCTSEYQEGDAIANFSKIAQAQGIRLNNCAVLYRTHFQSRAIEESLIKNAVPYKIFGGTQFYERKEIKDLIAYLRLIVNPFDRPSFFRIYNIPARGLGDAFETLFYEKWAHQPFMTFRETAQQIIDQGDIKGKKAIELQDFINLFNDIDISAKPNNILNTIIDRVGYIAYLKETHELEEAQARIENIHEFMRAIIHFEDEKKGTLAQFLEEVALLQEQSSKKSEDVDTLMLMTLHAAKGLEFDTVILAGLEEGLLPSSRSLHDEKAVEEERRLFYVGITRARERLILSRTRYRYNFGQMTDQLPSTFLGEIPDRMMHKHDLCYANGHKVQQLFNEWLGGKSMPCTEPIMTFGISKRIGGQIVEPIKDSTQNKTPTSWKINQPVKHKTFGIGLVKKIEGQGEQVSLTVNFGTEIKKVLSSFVEKI